MRKVSAGWATSFPRHSGHCMKDPLWFLFTQTAGESHIADTPGDCWEQRRRWGLAITQQGLRYRRSQQRHYSGSHSHHGCRRPPKSETHRMPQEKELLPGHPRSEAPSPCPGPQAAYTRTPEPQLLWGCLCSCPHLHSCFTSVHASETGATATGGTAVPQTLELPHIAQACTSEPGAIVRPHTAMLWTPATPPLC